MNRHSGPACKRDLLQIQQLMPKPGSGHDTNTASITESGLRSGTGYRPHKMRTECVLDAGDSHLGRALEDRIDHS